MPPQDNPQDQNTNLNPQTPYVSDQPAAPAPDFSAPVAPAPDFSAPVTPVAPAEPVAPSDYIAPSGPVVG